MSIYKYGFRMKRFILLLLILPVFMGLDALELGDYVLSGARPKGIPAMKQAKDGEHYYLLSESKDKILKVSYRNGKETTFFDSGTVDGNAVTQWDGYDVAPDENSVLLWTAQEPIYRHSFSADYYVYDVKRKSLTKLTSDGQEQIAIMSPDGRMVAYVKDNNIRIKMLQSESDIAVTSDGAVNKVINGVPDWVYQEEFGMLNSLCWSPDNSVLSFIRWDESQVPMYSMTLYEGACKPKEEYALYPGRFDFKYPVAGEQNSVVSVHSFDVATRELRQMNLPITATDYVQHIAFGTNADELMVSTLNRTQNLLHIYAVNPRSCDARQIYEETSESWIDSSLAAMVLYYDGFFIIPSDRSGYAQLYRYSTDGTLIRQITSGNESVTAFYGYDTHSGKYYYQSTCGPLNRAVFCTDDDGNAAALSPDSGTSSATFSSSMAYYVLNFSDLNTPNRYAVFKTGGKKLRDLQQNVEYSAKYIMPDVPRREFFTFTSDSVELNGYIIRPTDFDPSKRYPVIMSQYSGPGSQQVLNKWKIDWEEYAASQGFVVACVDGRGTGGRGKRFQDIVYLNLGHYETIDQIAAAWYMASLPYVDSDRIGIWGWSYGGYEVLMAMSQKDSPFAAGVSIAPVTSWRFYDTIYTERFMRTPQENPDGYEASAPLGKIDDFSGELLLMFGSADDNVHIINEMQYVAKMNETGRLIDMMVYPNMNHSINGCEIREPLYRKVMSFFEQKLMSR